ncbi:MAG: SLC13 family permease [Sulfolobales archaeon]|nr:SLC13 family permease [Sulfolobales archaeon]
MRLVYSVIFTSAFLFCVSYIVMSSIYLGVGDGLGRALIDGWRREVGYEVYDLNSWVGVLHQSLALTLFLLVVVITAIRMELRVFAALFAVVIVVLTDTVPPQYLISSAVEWDLILFLIGSMVLAGVLRELGVFKYLAVLLVRVSGERASLLVTLIFMFAFALAALLGEVTSIIYVLMLIFELGRLLRVDVKPLVVMSVIATNTGSTALPVGNPIGIYLFFSAGMSMGEFIKNAFTLSIIELLLLNIALISIWRGFMRGFSNTFSKSSGNVEAFVTSFYTHISREELSKVRRGLALLLFFIAAVTSNDLICHYLSNVFGLSVDPHAFLAFIPYFFTSLSASLIVPEAISDFIRRSVDWPSIIFFMTLFMLSYSLTYSGVMVKLTYALSSIKEPALLLTTLLIGSAFLSSVLDNLSVIVSMTPLATLLSTLGLVGREAYFALLFGGVFGGNYTPIGSTANIVAVSYSERRKVTISWRYWLRTSSIITSMQIVLALAWLFIVK